MNNNNQRPYHQPKPCYFFNTWGCRFHYTQCKNIHSINSNSQLGIIYDAIKQCLNYKHTQFFYMKLLILNVLIQTGWPFCAENNGKTVKRIPRICEYKYKYIYIYI